MALKRYSSEDILRLLREIEVYIHGGMDVAGACRKAGVSGKPNKAGTRNLAAWGALFQRVEFSSERKRSAIEDRR